MAYDPRQNSWFVFLIAHLNFQLQHFNFTAEFNISHSSFRIHIIGQCFYTCRLAFELNFLSVWKNRKPESGIGTGMGTGSGTGNGNGNGNGTGTVMLRGTDTRTGTPLF